jgi:hypothetical protein
MRRSPLRWLVCAGVLLGGGALLGGCNDGVAGPVARPTAATGPVFGQPQTDPALPGVPAAGPAAGQPPGTVGATGGTGGAAAPEQPSPETPEQPAAGDTRVAGVEFMRRIVGSWTGINSNTPIGFDFPMTVDFAPHGDSMVFGMFNIDAQNNVLWGFNIENYGGADVLAYRNGGYLGGLLRDSRAQLVEYDSEIGFYRFCAVKEMGIAVDGCKYIDARYTFSAPDKMLFEVSTRGGQAVGQHVDQLDDPVRIGAGGGNEQ